MFNKHLLLCLAVIAGNSWAQAKRLEKMELNAYNNRLFDLNDKIEQLQHEKQTITTLLANNQSSVRKNKVSQWAVAATWLYVLHTKSKDKELIKALSELSLTGCLSNLLADRSFMAPTIWAIGNLCNYSIKQNSFSTKINCQKQALKNIDDRLEKFMHQKQLLEGPNKPDAVTIGGIDTLQYEPGYQAKDELMNVLTKQKQDILQDCHEGQ